MIHPAFMHATQHILYELPTSQQHVPSCFTCDFEPDVLDNIICSYAVINPQVPTSFHCSYQ